ncbi:MAG: helicase-exonuclease AddAB subunit AddA [Clostridiales bacterium]|jgi:ATP-dependent helicase/nuclease subunit A|nr:helicase-exonuclease AddAB subunit AddA [Clostridiales bacterium]
MGFTEEQLAAINTTGRDLLVAAAAGSGKTAVLVERIMRLIANNEKPVDIDRLLVVTFTEAAASEMRERIEKALVAKLEADPDDERATRQLALLPMASICTIHAFCRKIMKQYFNLVDLDPEFRVGDEAELKLIRFQVMEDLFEEEYALEDNADFFELVECFGGGKTQDIGLGELVERLCDFIESSPYPADTLNKYEAMFSLESEERLDKTPWAQILKNEAARELEGVLESISRAESICREAEGPDRYLAALSSDRDQALAILRASHGALEELYQEILAWKPMKLPAYRKSDERSSEAQREKVKAIRQKEIKDRISGIREDCFFKSPEAMAKDVMDLQGLVSKLARLARIFRANFAEAKKERNLVDFSDMEHFCIEILLTDKADDPSPTIAAKELKARYVEVMIDEYQDSNALQELILTAASGASRFMVGDVKQSIYKFRRANPYLFIDKYERFSSDAGNSEGGLRIDLSKNFRSRASVLNACNFFFSQIMDKTVGEVAYDSKQALYPGAEFPSKRLELYKTEVDLVEYVKPEKEDDAQDEPDEKNKLEELSKQALEAQVIAQRIKSFLDPKDPLMVLDAATRDLRPCRMGDIVVLARSIAGVSNIISDELKRLDIPAYADASASFFDSIEVITAMSFLRAIDNPRQDLHLVTILHSPVYGLSPDELMDVRQAAENGSFYGCVKAYMELGLDTRASRRIKAFMEDLSRWRKRCVFLPVSGLISEVYEDTGYFNMAGAMPAGAVRQGNLRALREKAVEYETTTFKGLFQFIRYMERLKASGADMAVNGQAPGGGEFVRIMTIHKSKGLEFPVVVVAMLGKNFNMADEKENIIFHQELGLGPVRFDVLQRTKSNTLPHFALSKKIRLENLSEELRVLYVALTRAKEKLVLTGCVSDLQSHLEKWCVFANASEAQIPKHYRARCKSFLDFLAPCLARHRDGEILRERAGEAANLGSAFFCDPSEFDVRLHFGQAERIMSLKSREASNARLEELKGIRAGSNYSGLEKEIEKKIWWSYPYRNQMDVPSKVSISEIKRLCYSEVYKGGQELPETSAGIYFEQPQFMREGRFITNVERGTAIHTVMEKLDIYRHTDAQSILALLDELERKNFLSHIEKKAIPVYKLVRFANSELAARMRRSGGIMRETPFVMGLRHEIMLPGRNADKNLPSELVLVHGIVDCFFEEEDGMVLVDYKSDSVNEESKWSLAEKYRIQLQIYADAIVRGTGRKVKQALLYLFALDSTIEVKLSAAGASGLSSAKL